MNALNLQKKGRLGEDIAVKYLLEQGFSILKLNERIGRSEIDIIASKDSCIYFIEVKSSFDQSAVEPFHRIGASKLKALYRGVAGWCHKNAWRGQTEVMCIGVRVDLKMKKATVEHFLVGI